MCGHLFCYPAAIAASVERERERDREQREREKERDKEREREQRERERAAAAAANEYMRGGNTQGEFHVSYMGYWNKSVSAT